MLLSGDISGRQAPAANVLDDFEHNDLAGTYAGDLGEFSIQTGTVYEGTHALGAVGGTAESNIISRTDVTFSPGETLSLWAYPAASGANITFDYAVQSGTGYSTIRSYEIAMYSGNADFYTRNGNGNTTYIGWQGVNFPTGQWVEVQLEWVAGTNEHNLSVYEADGTLYSSGSWTDSLITTAGGIGFNSDDTANTYYDYVTIVE